MLTGYHYRDGMREQQELSDDIVNALGQNANPIDEHELEEDLELLQQEQLDEAMLKTGTVPVLPSPATQERKFCDPAADCDAVGAAA